MELTIRSLNNDLSCDYRKSEGDKYLLFILPGDSKKGTNSDTYEALFENLANTDVSTIGVNFVSQGNSDGKREQLSLYGATKNFEDVYLYFRNNFPHYFKNGIYAYASSFGASIISNSSLILQFSKILFKSPAINLAKAYINDEGGIDELKKWRELRISENSGLSYSAYEESLKYNYYKYILLANGKFLIVVGSEDEIVGVEDPKLLSFNLNCPIEILNGVKHSYKENDGINKITKIALKFFIDDSFS